MTCSNKRRLETGESQHNEKHRHRQRGYGGRRALLETNLRCREVCRKLHRVEYDKASLHSLLLSSDSDLPEPLVPHTLHLQANQVCSVCYPATDQMEEEYRT
ncbi:hypothetical protein MHYP_G00323680 [Metynnis hypsauchen]